MALFRKSKMKKERSWQADYQKYFQRQKARGHLRTAMTYAQWKKATPAARRYAVAGMTKKEMPKTLRRKKR